MPTKKVPPLNTIAQHAGLVPGSRKAMNSEAAREARQDFMLYLGAAAAGLVKFSLRAWFKVRLPHFDFAVSLDALKTWAQGDAEVRELKAFLDGGPKTPTVEKWIVAGRKAWK